MENQEVIQPASTLTPSSSPSHREVALRTPPLKSETFQINVPLAGPRGSPAKELRPVRYGPATRGDMESLARYLITPPSSPTLLPLPAPLGTQFHDLPVRAVMDSFYRQLQTAIFIPVEYDDAYSLDARDWHGKLLESEKRLLDSVKRFILHTALYCARATDFAFPRYNERGEIHPSRLEPADSLSAYVDDVVALAKFLKESCDASRTDLPSLKQFIADRIAKVGGDRKYFFKADSERNTHVYARKACCVILGLHDDYDQTPLFGLTDWSNDVLIFDNVTQLLWKGFGLHFKGGDKKDLESMSGSIVDLDAHFIASGPFGFIRTNRVQEHLTLDRARRVRIYTSKALASTAFMFQNHIIARAAGISHLGLEIARSHALLFLQTPSARRLARPLHLDLQRVYLSQNIQPYDFKTIFYDELKWGNIPRLEDFHLLRPRLKELQREMIEWRPQSVGDLFRRGYKDPLTWYGFWFAGFVGIVAIASLIVSITQTVATFLLT